MNNTLIAVVFFLFFVACEQTSSNKTYPLHLSDAIMGTRYTIKVTSIPSAINKAELSTQIRNLLSKIDKKMSTYRQDSELSQFNKSQSIAWQSISPSLFVVLSEAKKIHQLTQGAFDITVGGLVNLWGFGSDPMTQIAVEDSEIDVALNSVGSNFLQLDKNNQKIKKDIPDLYLDLSAIAKGYAVDLVGELLEAHEIVDYMVEIGGELRLRGGNANNQSWRIAIEKPTAEARMIQKVLPLSNISLATSGDYRNYFEVDGVRFSHSIDPRTGKPITHKLASVTILSDTTIVADALATALMVLGSDEGYKLAERENIAALFIIKVTEGFVEKATPAFEKKLKRDNAMNKIRHGY